MIATHTEPYKSKGTWNYTELPEGMRKAMLDDFSILSDELVFGINILFKPDAIHDYQAFNIGNTQELNNWKTKILAGNVFVDKLPYKQFGLWYYPRLPLVCRRAMLSDFFTANVDIISGVDFVVLGSLKNDYEVDQASTLP